MSKSSEVTHLRFMSTISGDSAGGSASEGPLFLSACTAGLVRLWQLPATQISEAHEDSAVDGASTPERPKNNAIKEPETSAAISSSGKRRVAASASSYFGPGTTCLQAFSTAREQAKSSDESVAAMCLQYCYSAPVTHIAMGSEAGRVYHYYYDCSTAVGAASRSKGWRSSTPFLMTTPSSGDKLAVPTSLTPSPRQGRWRTNNRRRLPRDCSSTHMLTL